MDKFFIGTDIVDINRISLIIKKSGNNFLNRIFTESERLYCDSNINPNIHYAGRFAAKEAVKKALLSSGSVDSISLISIEINRKRNGEPIVNTKLKKGWNCKVSISHTPNFAIAFSIYCFA
tara:strand:+ start:564 stop:926 length:363 start_codon:yes stop_codon:yes gene_type:complete